MIDEMLQAALAYAAQGIPVFPVQAGDKRPLPGSHGFQDATIDPEKIRAWWTAAPGSNVATCPAQSGRTVIDIDTKQGKVGGHTWSALCAEHAWVLPQTLVVRTPSTGWHVWFEGTMRPSVGTAKRGLGADIDIRSEDSYVLLPPSIVDGKRYEIVQTPGERLPPVPEWIRARVNEKRIEQRAALITEDGLDAPHNIERAEWYLRDRAQQGDIAIEGSGGNDRTFRLAATVMELGVSPEAAVDLIAAEWNIYCLPPWSEYELELIVANAARYMQNGKGASAAELGSESFAASPVLQDAVRESRGRWKGRRIRDMWHTKPVPFWGDRAMFPRAPGGSVGMLWGPSSSHKTGVAIETCYDLWLGSPEPPRVLFVTGEGDQGIDSRFRAHAISRGLDEDAAYTLLGDKLFLTDVPIAWQADDLASFQDYVENIERFTPDLVFIDTFATTLAGMDEDVKAAALLLATGALGKLARHWRCSICVIHHSGKDEGRGARGSGAFRDNVDYYLRCVAHKAAPRFVELHADKIKDGPGGHSVYYEVATVAGAPVPQRIEEGLYTLGTKAEGLLTQAAVQSALGVLKALSPETATTANLVAYEALRPHARGLDPEKFSQLTTRLGRTLDKRAAEFGMAGDGRWWLTVAG